MQPSSRSHPVRRARAKRFWTQGQLASLAHVSRSTVIRAECGKRVSPISEARIAQALGELSEDLFELEAAS